jgi:hypothetical protein
MGRGFVWLLRAPRQRYAYIVRHIADRFDDPLARLLLRTGQYDRGERQSGRAGDYKHPRSHRRLVGAGRGLLRVPRLRRKRGL